MTRTAALGLLLLLAAPAFAQTPGAPAAPESVTWVVFVERFGSFGLIAVALLWGAPKLLTFLREQRQEFTSTLREMRTDHAATIKTLVEKHEARLDTITAAHDQWQSATNGVVSRLVDQVANLAARFDARRHPE